jgi:phosphoribosyl 1,2-cyclic phosphodiesterase
MSEQPVRVEFHGVRGSTPCAGPQYTRYGGHSSCVSLTVSGEAPIIFDLGTGLTPYGDQLGGPAHAFHGHALLSHMHWDHVQGLPFFTPLHHPESTLDIYAPAQVDASAGETFGRMMQPPFFPIRYDQLRGDIQFHDVTADRIDLGHAVVRSRNIPHVGPTLGFRVEWNGVSVAYLSDHGPGCCGAADLADPGDIARAALELCDGADLVIHDAQHTEAEYEMKRDWGHCSYEFAVRVAHEAGAKRLALFHHCPSHGDDMIDRIQVDAAHFAARLGSVDVFAAAEGVKLDLEATRR